MLFHVTSRLQQSQPLWTDPASARKLARRVLKFGADYRLTLFSAPSDHIHTVVHCSRRRAGLWARALEGALTRALDFNPGFRPAHIQPVVTHAHRRRMVDYVFDQHRKHGVLGDPLLECSNLLDALSIRLIDNRSAFELKDAYPWLTAEDLLPYVGGPVAPNSNLERLPEAIRVVCGGLPIESKKAPARRAREAGIRLARRAGLGFQATASLIGVSRSAVTRALSQTDSQADLSVARATALLERVKRRTAA